MLPSLPSLQCPVWFSQFFRPWMDMEFVFYLMSLNYMWKSGEINLPQQIPIILPWTCQMKGLFGPVLWFQSRVTVKKRTAFSTNFLENSLYKHDTRITMSHISRWAFFVELLKPSIQRAILKEQPEIFKSQGDQISHVLAVMNPATM